MAGRPHVNALILLLPGQSKHFVVEIVRKPETCDGSQVVKKWPDDSHESGVFRLEQHTEESEWTKAESPSSAPAETFVEQHEIRAQLDRQGNRLSESPRLSRRLFRLSQAAVADSVAWR